MWFAITNEHGMVAKSPTWCRSLTVLLLYSPVICGLYGYLTSSQPFSCIFHGVKTGELASFGLKKYNVSKVHDAPPRGARRTLTRPV